MNKITHSIDPTELKIGQFFTRSDENDETYILSKIDGKFVLVCLDDGEYWGHSTIKIIDAFGTSSQREQFNLVTKPFTITPQ